jgi:periplasmic divalent cation tolerance protein
MVLPVVIITSCNDSQSSANLAVSLLNKKLAACVTEIPEALSRYYWQGKLEEQKEIILMIKTLDSLVENIYKEFKTLHPYETPEFVICKTDGFESSYSKWIKEVTLTLFFLGLTCFTYQTSLFADQDLSQEREEQLENSKDTHHDNLELDPRLPPVLPGEEIIRNGKRIKVWSSAGSVSVATPPAPGETPLIPNIPIIVDKGDKLRDRE